MVDSFLGSFCRAIGASGARPAAAALPERVGGVERLVCVLSELRERRLGEDAHLHHQVKTVNAQPMTPWGAPPDAPPGGLRLGSAPPFSLERTYLSFPGCVSVPVNVCGCC